MTQFARHDGSDELAAKERLKNISYYRLKGYWWDMQLDRVSHTFAEGSVFENVVSRYDFDRHLRLVLFEAVEQIEISLRAKMINHLSLSYSGTWYQNETLFDN